MFKNNRIGRYYFALLNERVSLHTRRGVDNPNEHTSNHNSDNNNTSTVASRFRLSLWDAVRTMDQRSQQSSQLDDNNSFGRQRAQHIRTRHRSHSPLRGRLVSHHSKCHHHGELVVHFAASQRDQVSRVLVLHVGQSSGQVEYRAQRVLIGHNVDDLVELDDLESWLGREPELAVCSNGIYFVFAANVYFPCAAIRRIICSFQCMFFFIFKIKYNLLLCCLWMASN